MFTFNAKFQLLFTAIMAVGFFLGSLVFGIFSYSMAEFAYSFSEYGVSTLATITNCEMVAGRSKPHAFVTYSYTVNREIYFDTWLAQFAYENCSEVQLGTSIDITYLEYKPSSSIEGTMGSPLSSYAVTLLCVLGSVGHGFASVKYARKFLSYLRSEPL
ncbi:MAG: hypothetical protein CL607_16955 [Anaerolineaceae bacterium]|nr:hypothetical protein [Anaerolineaceae bacterium]